MSPYQECCERHTTTNNWELDLNAHILDFRALTFYSVNAKMQEHGNYDQQGLEIRNNKYIF